MILASLWGTGFLIVGGLLALWSLWWIVKGALTNPVERDAEVSARERFARGEGWAEGDPGQSPFSDAELMTLADSQRADDLSAAGVEARREPPKRRGRGSTER